MLEIKMDDDSLYRYENEDYTDYDITKEYVVVKNKESWIGVFDKRHFVCLVCC